jgi:hypothetical protein
MTYFMSLMQTEQLAKTTANQDTLMELATEHAVIVRVNVASNANVSKPVIKHLMKDNNHAVLRAISKNAKVNAFTRIAAFLRAVELKNF